MTDEELEDIIAGAEKALHAMGSVGLIENPGNRLMDAYGLLTTVSSAALLARMLLDTGGELTRDEKYHVLAEAQSAVFAPDPMFAAMERFVELMCLSSRLTSKSEGAQRDAWLTIHHLTVAASGLTVASMTVSNGGIPITTSSGEPRVVDVREILEKSRERVEEALQMIDKTLAGE